ncbi:type II toxin-antitoxin system Phd/YefM family antitoxin [Pseudomonas veronii]|uniref:type II toxin-antitoxin system Phd/YefM family antitoxin n=1 Tax=Pseudomonas veronii TaxID=76761 RepID=UPI001E5AF934|nr:type II toxin-antitoxin system Phd/YefM family antitoxin [Pseudomonas veronii]
METINYTNARAHFSETMDRVNDDHIPLLLTRQKGEPVVMISLSEFNALEETDPNHSNTTSVASGLGELPPNIAWSMA